MFLGTGQVTTGQVGTSQVGTRAAALQSVAVRRLTGNDVSGPIFSPLFIFSHFFLHFFHLFHSPSRPFLIEGVLGSKILSSKSCLKWPHHYREVISDF